MKPHPTTRCIPLVALFAAIAASGCDTRELLEPGARAVAPRRSVDAPRALGTTMLAPPPTSAPTVVSSNPYEPFATLPESTWVVVNVSGQIQLTWNADACAQRQATDPYWPCQDGSPTGNFGAKPGDGGPVSVRGTFSTGRNTVLKLRGSGGAGESSGSAVGLAFNSSNAPMALSGRVAAGAVWAWDPNYGNGPFSWYMGGGYTVTATAVPSPFQVTESAPDADGFVTYTAEALYGLEFLNPTEFYWNPPAGAATWRFFSGDSLSDKPDLSGRGVEVNQCAQLLVCRYKPPKAGRMQVRAYVETQLADVRSKPAGCQYTPEPLGSVRASVSGSVCGQEPKLVLKCDGRTDADSVTRGNRMRCEVSAEPAGATPADLRWQFQDDQAHTIPGPTGDTKEWGGIMVVGGQMQVSASLNGKPASATLAVTVTPRDWTGKITFPPEPQPEWVSGPPLLYPPIVEGDTLVDGSLGLSTWPRPEAASGFGEGTGPNEGWFFFDQPPYFTPRQSHIYINNALKPTDPFWRAQRGPPPNEVVFGRPKCGPDFMRHAARHVPAHEHGHYSQAAALANSAQGAALLESAVHWGDPVSDEEYNEMTRNYVRADSALVAHWDSVNILYVPCDFTRP